MKLHTNNLRRLSLFVSLILLLTGLLPACNASSSPQTEVTDALLKAIEKDFAKNEYANGADPKIDGPWHIEYCYGIYDGCVAVMFSLPSCGVHWEDEIADSISLYRNSLSILVWKNGSFMSIKEAYDQGMLSKEDVAKIAKIHNNDRYVDLNGN